MASSGCNDVDVDELVHRTLVGHGVVEADEQARCVRAARHLLRSRATEELCRVLVQAAALADGWQPSTDATLRWPMPSTEPVRSRVLGWASKRADFSVRELMRSTGWFARAADARECVAALVGEGELEQVPVVPREPGQRGRTPSLRFRRPLAAFRTSGPPAPVREPSSRPDPVLDWPEFDA